MDLLASPSFYDALTLKERLQALRAAAGSSASSDVAEAPPSRLDAWRKQAPFERGDLLARRLARDGITEEEFSRILREPADVVRGRVASRPGWLEKLERVYGSSRAPEPQGASESGTVGFADLARPLVADGCARFREALERLPAPPFDLDLAVQLLTAHLEVKLSQMVDRTLVLELNVARLRGELAGETPAERFISFLLQLREPERALRLLAEYPALARQLVRAIDQGVAFYLELFERLAADFEAIRASLNGGADPGKLVEVTGGVGDTHRKGRSVLIVRFDSGFKVVYKPRPMALDVHFQELLAWLNERGIDPPLRTLRVVDRGEHGWVEFVEGEGCRTHAEVDRFHRRQGAYLALLYVLDATDFHQENLIADGEHPILLDLEALLHAHVRGVDLPNPAQRAASACLEDSVVRIGFLPQRIWANAESEGVDMSGFGSATGELTPFRLPRWKDLGTDEMRLGRERVVIPAAKNRPTLGGAEVDVTDHTEAVCAGFAATYAFLERHRAELLSPDGPLARFAQDEVRVILRPTQTYAVLLRESFHPDLLRNELDRTRLFDRLWTTVEGLPHLARVIPGEVDELEDGDIPMFTTRPDSRDLWSGSGERLPGFFEESSLAHVRRRIEELGAADLERQLWFVRASLATVSQRGIARRGDPATATGSASREELLAVAREVGDELGRRALRADGAATWIGLSQAEERSWALVPLGSDLYDGLPGVALFLAYLSAVTGEERHGELARAAIRALRADLPGVREVSRSIGAFTGLGGVVYALLHLGALWRDAELLEEARATVGWLSARVERDEHLDVIGGAAGCIGALLALHRHDRAQEALDVARQCGERLVASAKPMERGVGWLTPIARDRPLSGFSHGAAGMAWALLHLAAATDEPRFRATALEAIAYERTLFSPERGNWWDVRDVGPGGTPGHCVTAWCHGAPGIGLARLDTLGTLDDAEVRAEIAAAVEATIRSGFGDAHALCHGDLGNVELVARAASALDDAGLRARTDRIARGVLDDVRASGWQCGNPMRVQSPGLMTGLAGIGWGFLRLAAPERVPSVLLLEPPRRDQVTAAPKSRPTA